MKIQTRDITKKALQPWKPKRRPPDTNYTKSIAPLPQEWGCYWDWTKPTKRAMADSTILINSNKYILRVYCGPMITNGKTGEIEVLACQRIQANGAEADRLFIQLLGINWPKVFPYQKEILPNAIITAELRE